MSESAPLTAHVAEMATAGVSFIPNVGSTPEEILAWSADLPEEIGYKQPVVDYESLPKGIATTIEAVGDVIQADRTQYYIQHLPPFNGEHGAKESHTDIIDFQLPTAASLLIPVRSGLAHFAFSRNRFKYPFEVPPPGVSLLRYGLAQAVLQRQDALRLVRERGDKPFSPGGMHHGGWFNEDRLLLIARFTTRRIFAVGSTAIR